MVPSGGGLIGAPASGVVVSLTMDEWLWDEYNRRKFDEWNLGAYP